MGFFNWFSKPAKVDILKHFPEQFTKLGEAGNAAELIEVCKALNRIDNHRGPSHPRWFEEVIKIIEETRTTWEENPEVLNAIKSQCETISDLLEEALKKGGRVFKEYKQFVIDTMTEAAEKGKATSRVAQVIRGDMKDLNADNPASSIQAQLPTLIKPKNRIEIDLKHIADVFHRDLGTISNAFESAEWFRKQFQKGAKTGNVRS